MFCIRRRHYILLLSGHPISLANKRFSPPQYGSNSDADLNCRLRDAHAKCASKEGELDRLEKHRSTLVDRIDVQKKAREAYIEVLRMLEDHKSRHMENRSKAQLHEKDQ